MRLGVAGLMPRDARDVTPAHAARLRELGLFGVTCLLPDPSDCTREQMERVRQVLLAEGVVPAQANASYERLIDPDDDLRGAGIAGLQAACRCTAWLQAPTLYVRPGSISRAGHWAPHPLNTHPETIARLVRSLQIVARVAEEEGVTLAIEGHAVSTLETAARVRSVIDAVGSPSLLFNIDPVNFVSSIPVAYQNRALIDDLYDALDGKIAAAHAKDVRVEDRLVVHIAECAPGEGILDMEHFLTRFQRSCPDGWVLIEHLPDAQVPAAARAMRAAAERAGVTWA
jgi:sugar phosphate isomerase/epimerase